MKDTENLKDAAVPSRRLIPAAEWQKYHSSFHTSTLELAKMAREARPGLLVLYHQLFWGVTEERLVAEIQEVYTGRVVSARDLDVY